MAGYIRQSSFVDGDTITAALFNNEYNQLLNAFNNATGHAHDGTTAEGPVIGLIGDAGETAPNNKVLIDTTNNFVEFYVQVSSAPVQQLYIADGAIIPVTDSDIDLGTSSLYFKNAYIDSITTTGNIDVGGNLTVTGTTTFNGGTITMGDAATDNVVFGADINSSIIPNTDDTYDLGSSSQEWRNLYIDGTANIDSLVADTADINAGTIDGATIATSDITVGAGKTLDVSAGTLTLADNQISGDKVEGGTINATTITTLASTTGNVTTVNATTVDSTNLEVTNLKAKDGTAAGSIADSTGVVTLGSSVLTTTDINGGTIDGVTIGGTTAGAVTFTDLSDGTITITAFADEDDMSSDSATLVPTQQSVKAYVDSQVTAQDLDFQGDTGGALSIDLDSETLTVAGGTGLDTVGSGNTITVNIDSTVATLTGSQTLTNKTLTSPDVNTPDIDGGTIDSTVIGGTTPAAGTFTTLTANTSITGTLATAAQPNITSLGTLTTLTVDDITINGSTISDAGDLTLDVAGDIILDAAGTQVILKKAGTQFGEFLTSSTPDNLYIKSSIQDKDIIFGGNDGGSAITALTLDVSDAGTAIFNHDIKLGDNGIATFGAGDDLQIYHDGTASWLRDVSIGDLYLDTNGTKISLISDGSYDTGKMADFVKDGAVTLYHDNAAKLATTSTGIDVTGTVTATGTSVFASLDISGDIDVDGTTNLDVVDIDGALTQDGGAVFNEASADVDFRVESNGNANMLFVDGGLNIVSVGSSSVYQSGALEVFAQSDASSQGVSINGADSATSFRLYTVGDVATIGRGGDNPAISISTGNAVTINENSLDADFRVESNGNANMLFVNGEFDAVGIGTTTFDANHQLHVLANETTPNVSLLLQSDDTANATSILRMFARNGSNDNKVTTLTNSAGSLAFGTNDGTERASITAAGMLVLQEGNGLHTDTLRSAATAVTTSATNIINFATAGGIGSALGYYLVTVVREGGSVGTAGVYLVGLSSSSLVILYETLSSNSLTASTSGANFQVAVDSGSITCHATAIPISIAGND
jgi:hypothetical protein